ncbi:ATP-binding protein [Xanthobacter sp. YC-JY1]|uniref:ATP-binding protein n=1 Tax=Xanthobacter sp. YC-JY1 TaxID=2419844 RepID=UPI001F159A30|nr:ATP-binding protein [Xanthobacter sp. YC-JY1]
MSSLSFIEPAGVTFLSNIGYWLVSRGCNPRFINIDNRNQSIIYLDDSLFFEQHCGSRLRVEACPRRTTQPLQRIDHDRIHSWLRMELIPWLSSCLGMTQSSLSMFQVCISELFNNINDHSIPNTGSIFVQHYPNKNEIRIAVADFGPGIPSTVARRAPNLTDVQAILKAVEPGFSSLSSPRNRGAGLDILLETAVRRNGGRVTIFSQSSYVVFSQQGCHVHGGVGFCPGTTIDICLRTDTIEQIEDGPEDLEW